MTIKELTDEEAEALIKEKAKRNKSSDRAISIVPSKSYKYNEPATSSVTNGNDNNNNNNNNNKRKRVVEHDNGQEHQNEDDIEEDDGDADDSSEDDDDDDEEEEDDEEEGDDSDGGDEDDEEQDEKETKLLLEKDLSTSEVKSSSNNHSTNNGKRIDDTKLGQLSKTTTTSNGGMTKKKTRRYGNGLQVSDVKIGRPDGKIAKAGNKVRVRYIGKLTNGTIFDQTPKKGRPFEFRLGIGEVIKGWDVGVVGMREGDVRELTIPPSLGYGRQRIGKIPANSTLNFEIELLKVS